MTYFLLGYFILSAIDLINKQLDHQRAPQARWMTFFGSRGHPQQFGNTGLATIECEEDPSRKGPGRGQVPEIECRMSLLPTVCLTQRLSHRHRVSHIQRPLKKQFAIYRPVKAINHAPRELGWLLRIDA
jgi:hypothetical protein